MKLLVSYQTFLIQTRSVYRHEKLRKLDLGRYILQQKAESAMVRDFRKRCGHHNNTFIVAGSWNCKTPRNLKNLAPVRGNRIKRIFQRAKYKVYIIDENRTSKACSKCCNHSNPNTGQSEMSRSVSSSDNYSETGGGGLPVEPETAKVCENFLVLSKGKMVKKHGIIKCSHCETIWNR